MQRGNRESYRENKEGCKREGREKARVLETAQQTGKVWSKLQRPFRVVSQLLNLHVVLLIWSECRELTTQPSCPGIRDAMDFYVCGFEKLQMTLFAQDEKRGTNLFSESSRPFPSQLMKIN